MTIVVVGFTVKQKHSVFYRAIPAFDPTNEDDQASLLTTMKRAIDLSDFISVRCLRNNDNT